MEERESPVSRDNGQDELPPQSPRSPPPPPPLPPQSPPPKMPLPLPPYLQYPLPPPPGKLNLSSETYVVHFPRDQVYRVPPPENARFADLHRINTFKNKSSSSNGGGGGGGCSFCRLLIIVLILIALGISIFIAMILTLYSPKYPEFSIKNFHEKSLSNYHNSQQRLIKNKNNKKNNNNNGKNSYSISLRINNPNERMIVQYDKGKMLLEFKGKVIASGKYISMEQEEAKEIVVIETLNGTKKPLTKSMVKSLNNNNNNTNAKSMVLKIYVPIKITSWIITSEKHLIVTCDFKIKSFANKKKGTKILSQECETEH